jgi:hypothetical protein
MPDANPTPLVLAASPEGLTSPEEIQDPAGPPGLAPGALEETLVTDARAGLTPAQLVERKLVALLKTNPLPISHVRAGSHPLRLR